MASTNYLRIKLRKNQSTIPTEKLHEGLVNLEIIGDSIESLPSLAQLSLCKNLLLVCPELQEIPKLPENLEILKIKTGRTFPQQLPRKLHTLQLSQIKSNKSLDLELPRGLVNLDLSSNALHCVDSINLGAPLTRINLDHNQLTQLPEILYNNPSLLHLSLDGNPLLEEEKNKLFKTFGIWF